MLRLKRPGLPPASRSSPIDAHALLLTLGLELTYERPVVRYASCRAAAGDTRFAGNTRVLTNFEYSLGHATPTGGWTGTLTFRIMSITMTLRHPSWPQMTPADVEAVAKSQAALDLHEQGHAAIAARAVHAFNEHPVSIETENRADYDRVMQTAGSSALTSIDRRQEEYDLLTDHGRRQHLAEPDLRGPDTELRCTR